jgi:hypothetical protein
VLRAHERIRVDRSRRSRGSQALRVAWLGLTQGGAVMSHGRDNRWRKSRLWYFGVNDWNYLHPLSPSSPPVPLAPRPTKSTCAEWPRARVNLPIGCYLAASRSPATAQTPTLALTAVSLAHRWRGTILPHCRWCPRHCQAEIRTHLWTRGGDHLDEIVLIQAQ